MNNSFSSEIFWKIFKMFQWLFTPPMVSFLYQSDKFDIVTKFTVFTFWQVLSKTFLDSQKLELCVRVDKSAGVRDCKTNVEIPIKINLCLAVTANVCTNQFLSYSLIIDVYRTLKESTLWNFNSRHLKAKIKQLPLNKGNQENVMWIIALYETIAW